MGCPPSAPDRPRPSRRRVVQGRRHRLAVRPQGVHTTLVCCTGGEEGDILNPAMDRPEVRERMGDVRRDELTTAAKIIGYDEVVMLGYRDSGMPDSGPTRTPRPFANAPLDEAVGRLVADIRRERPQVVVTYSDDQRGYPHPDHLKVHDITIPASDGPPIRTATPTRRSVAGLEALLHDVVAGPDAGHPREVPGARPRIAVRRRLDEAADQDHRITTSVAMRRLPTSGATALMAHATQVDPTSPFWFGLPPEVTRDVHPYDDYDPGPLPGRLRGPRDRPLRRRALSGLSSSRLASVSR